jgi:hypothetical protein
MKRFTGHEKPWGEFLDVKVNAAALLRRQHRRARPGRVLFCSVTDPYQPAEKVHRLTRSCLESLLDFRSPVSILTRLPLVLRDLDLLTRFRDPTVGPSRGRRRRGRRGHGHSDRVRALYRRHGLTDYLEDGWFEATAAAFRGEGGGVPRWLSYAAGPKISPKKSRIAWKERRSDSGL